MNLKSNSTRPGFIIQVEGGGLVSNVKAKGQGAVVLALPPCGVYGSIGDKFSCRTIVSYPTPFDNETADFVS